MAEKLDLTAQETHFAFGRNWASYAKLVTEDRIEEAVTGLRRLVGGRLDDQRFIDIGCGSGLHALAALRLGAAEVVAVDVDPDSVSTSRKMLTLHAAARRWQVLQSSVFDLNPDVIGRFDVVYSWGVLHHTGDMLRAIRSAAALVGPGGMFVVALYRKTRLCGFWKREKRWYSKAGPLGQAVARSVYLSIFRIMLALQGRTLGRRVAEYAGNRGMDFHHDVHDWLGGWPYESISPAEFHSLMRSLEMTEVREFVMPGMSSGMLSSGCDEYVYSLVPR